MGHVEGGTSKVFSCKLAHWKSINIIESAALNLHVEYGSINLFGVGSSLSTALAWHYWH